MNPKQIGMNMSKIAIFDKHNTDGRAVYEWLEIPQLRSVGRKLSGLRTLWIGLQEQYMAPRGAQGAKGYHAFHCDEVKVVSQAIRSVMSVRGCTTPPRHHAPGHLSWATYALLTLWTFAAAVELRLHCCCPHCYVVLPVVCVMWLYTRGRVLLCDATEKHWRVTCTIH